LCLTNRVSSTVSNDQIGEGNCGTGETTIRLPLRSDFYLTGNLLRYRCNDGPKSGEPCKGVDDFTTCTAGTCEEISPGRCNGGTNAGAACSSPCECPLGTCGAPVLPCPVCNPAT